LRKAEAAAPATGLFVPSAEAADVVAVLTGLSLETLPACYHLAGGFLVKLASASMGPVPRAIRLRSPAPALFVPVDADLFPTLSADEAAALVRRQGLVFLPGGRVLGYDPQQPLPLTALLISGRVRRGDWRPLPAAPQFPDRLQILDERPQDTPD